MKVKIDKRRLPHTLLWRKQQSKRMSREGNPMYGKIHPCRGIKRNNKDIDIKKVIELINNEYNIGKIMKETKFSRYLIYKHLIKYSDMFKKLEYNNKTFRKGRINYWLKGKTYEEIFKSKQKAERRAKVTSDWMKTEKNIRRFCKHPSKPQVDLFKLIKIKYENAILEHPIKIDKEKTIWLDIALLKERINIEYDGEYWHKLNGVEKDRQRDNFLKSKGWKIIRVKSSDKNVIKTLSQGGLKL